jgi:hypothetical protein
MSGERKPLTGGNARPEPFGVGGHLPVDDVGQPSF